MRPVLLCLDSGTTAVKAGAFDLAGRLLLTAERPNDALHREGVFVEQDMEATRELALGLLADLLARLGSPRVEGIVLTGQGDGLWPIDAAGAPVGRAMTWLDGRARGLVAELPEALDAVQEITGSRLTAASQSLQLLWLQRHDPARLSRIRHALRLKEWLFFALTGAVMAEPSAVLPAWGRWQDSLPSEDVTRALGLRRGTELLPAFHPVGEARAPLAPAPAAAMGLQAGVPVLLGPGDVHSTLIGLGLGSRPEVARASIFGTSAIHAGLELDPASRAAPAPAGAMVQKFALGPGYLCFHPCFNGATLLHHLERAFTELPRPAPPAYSGLILHPFFEPGGERAPWTDPHASGALIGMTATTTPAEIAWAGREALAFVARHSHGLMGGMSGALALGGGLAADRDFAGFLATLTGAEVERRAGGHAGLVGLAALGARHLLDLPLPRIAADWIPAADEVIAPQTGAAAEYAALKYARFAASVAALSPHWEGLSALRRLAEEIAP